MSRKKHPHQSKSEAHLEAAAATPSAEAVVDGVEGNGRVRRMVQSAEDLAKKRLQGTRIELVLDAVPVRLEKALDGLLDRVGLVRKSKLDGRRPRSAAVGQPA